MSILNKNYKHGHGSPGQTSSTWKSWQAMRQRCNYPKDICYKNYGGRGIKVCSGWQNSFVNFLSDMGERPNGFVLDRIDNEKGYDISNCRWSSILDSARNKTNLLYIEFNGEKKCLKEWCLILGLNYQAVYKRLFNYNWSVSEAFSKKISKNNKKWKHVE